LPKRYLETGVTIGIHAIGGHGLKDLYANHNTIAPTVKYCATVGDIQNAPNSKTKIARFISHDGINLENFDNNGDPYQQAEQRAADLIPLLAPHQEHIDYVEIINEQKILNPQQAITRAQFFIRAMEIFEQHGYKLAILNESIGCPEFADYDAMATTELFEKCAQGNHAIALHSGGGLYNDSDLQYLMLRHVYLYDNYILPRKLNIPLFFTELAPWESELRNPGFNYMNWIKRADELLKVYPYFAGAHLFTLDSFGGWDWYHDPLQNILPQLTQWTKDNETRQN